MKMNLPLNDVQSQDFIEKFVKMKSSLNGYFFKSKIQNIFFGKWRLCFYVNYVFKCKVLLITSLSKKKKLFLH